MNVVGERLNYVGERLRGFDVGAVIPLVHHDSIGLGIARSNASSTAAIQAGLRSPPSRTVGTLISAAHPHEPVWTWSRQKDVAFVVRHQVKEAAVHSWDAGDAAGIDVALDAAAATDAVEEFLQHTAAFRNKDAEPVGGRLALVATDGGMGWAVEEATDGSVRWQRADGASQPLGSVVRASAADLLLYLYGRRPAAALDVTGEVAVAERFALRNPTV